MVRTSPSNARGVSSTPGPGSKILPASLGQKTKTGNRKDIIKTFNTAFKHSPHQKKKNFFLSNNLATIESVSWRGWRSMAGTPPGFDVPARRGARKTRAWVGAQRMGQFVGPSGGRNQQGLLSGEEEWMWEMGH